MDRNPARLCVLRGAQMALFPMAVLSVFLQRQVGFTVTDIMLLQAVFGMAMVIFEFPSGYLADRIGYRRTLVLAFALWTVAWPIYGYSTTWWGVAGAELLLGVGMALLSGCDSALMYESLLATGREHEFARWSGRHTFWGQLAEGGGALAAGLLFAWGVQGPFLAQGAASAVGLLVALSLVEPPRERPDFTDSLGQVRAMIRHVARENTELRALIVAVVVLGLASFIPVWTVQLYAVDAGLPEPWLGPMWAVANFTVALAALASHRLVGRWPLAATAGLCAALIVLGYLGLGLSHVWWGFVAYYALMVMRGLQGPVFRHREQQLVPSSDRAGFVSLRSMVFRSGFLVAGPLVGWSVDHRGQHWTMLVLAGVFFVASCLVALGLRRVARSGSDSGAG
ncbi:Major facilitator superfamily MFS_1 [Plesiocystis pacifica SIR-1]|uniref:Major facilitator superfamily MFS_1 n=1 Tax=Plesiocystis pacifica SIR-1 TaxID=391625 RepID=A6G405_9BACT|nr:MFS transporter [Plesiocystis pacifica]EDM79328.1 Major facilitator superfamily MFS_1 [Plesiocystis pacifica SIR-1]